MVGLTELLVSGESQGPGQRGAGLWSLPSQAVCPVLTTPGSHPEQRQLADSQALSELSIVRPGSLFPRLV